MNGLSLFLVIFVTVAIASINYRLWQLVILQRQQNRMLDDILDGLPDGRKTSK